MSSILFSVGELVSNLSLEDQVYIAKAANFDGIDYVLSLPDLVLNGNKIRELSQKYKTPVKGIHIPLFMILYTPPVFYNRLHSLVASFNDCEVFNVHLSSFINPLQKSGTNIEKFLSLKKQRNLVIPFESNPNSTKALLYYPKITYDPDQFAKYCIEHHLPINFDLSHIATFKYDINKFFTAYSKHIALLHVSDFDGKKQHLPLGKGNLPLEKLFKTIRKDRYNGKIIFEIYSFPRGSSKEQRLQEIKNSLEEFKRMTGL